MCVRTAMNLWYMVLTAMFLAGIMVPVSADEKRPNFIIILADDLGYGDLSCYWDQSPAKTPHLDRMAKEGLRFTDFHSNGNVCSPTRAALLTGRYQQRVGIPGVINADPKLPQHQWGIPDRETTIAEVLRKTGYRTGMFGKWHLGYYVRFNPTRHGFDTFRGFVSGNIDYHSHLDRMGTEDWWHDEKKIKVTGYSTHLITEHAIDFIKENRDRPFCAYIAHEAVHAPWQGPDDQPVRGPQKTSNPSSKQEALPKMLTELDKSVGKILKTLRDEKLDKNTFVFFCSDNGPAGGSSGPLRGRKGSNWEGGHRVPAIAWWPNKVRVGESTQPAMTADLMPTLIRIADIEFPNDQFDGEDLSFALFQGDSKPDRRLFWNGVAMRHGKWKLLLQGKQKKPLLFDLSSDLGEKKNIADQHPERTRRMIKELSQWRESTTHAAKQNGNR